MEILRCKMCGRKLNPINNSNICVCEYCYTRQAVSPADNKKKETVERLAPFIEILKDKNCPVSIACGDNHTVGLRADGTVVAVGDNCEGQRDVRYWSDIVSIACGIDYTVGLKADGTVVATGGSEFNQCLVGHWNDIVSIACKAYLTLGFKAGGTVVATKYWNKPYIEDWTDIVSMASLGGDDVVGLKSDGTVIATGENYKGCLNVSDWTDIVSIACGHAHTVGLRADGTVVATGDYIEGQCDVEDWTDIISVACGDNHTVGLRSDGSVVATGDYRRGQCDVEHWANIVSIACDSDGTIGLKADGTVVTTRSYGGCTWEKGNSAYWEEIVYIACGRSHLVGLRADGTVVAAGNDSYGQCYVSKWKLFDNLNQLKELTESRAQLVEERKREAAEEKIRRQALELQADRRSWGVCQYCGGEFKGLLKKKCVRCGKEKNY